MHEEQRQGRRRWAPRLVGMVGTAAVVSLALAGCFPTPPPLPTAEPMPPAPQPTLPSQAAPPPTVSDPAGPAPTAGGGQAVVPGVFGELLEGTLATDEVAIVEFTLGERAGVAIAAASGNQGDLTMRLTGNGVEVRADDSRSVGSAFGFDVGGLDPALGVVLDPGTYRLELAEYAGRATGYQLQSLITQTIISAGESAEIEFGNGAASVVVVDVTRGDEVISATSDVDTVLWAYDPIYASGYFDDDGSGSRDPRLELPGIDPQELVVAVSAYASGQAGMARVSVE